MFLHILLLMLLSCVSSNKEETPVPNEPILLPRPVLPSDAPNIIGFGGIINHTGRSGEFYIDAAAETILSASQNVRVREVAGIWDPRDPESFSELLRQQNMPYGIYGDLYYYEPFDLFVLQLTSFRNHLKEDRVCYQAAMFFGRADFQNQLNRSLFLHFPYFFKETYPDARPLVKGFTNPEDFLILIDPGHGGIDSGAVGNDRTYEKDLNNGLAEQVGRELARYGFPVEFTHRPDNDIYLNLPDRERRAEETNPDLFISLHHDARSRSRYSGYSVYYSNYKPEIDGLGLSLSIDHQPVNRYIGEKIINTETHIFYQTDDFRIHHTTSDMSFWLVHDATPSPQSMVSRELASRVQESLNNVGYIDPHFPEAANMDFFVIRRTNIPAILIEAGFISNDAELEQIRKPENQQAFAERLASAVFEYFRLKD